MIASNVEVIAAKDGYFVDLKTYYFSNSWKRLEHRLKTVLIFDETTSEKTKPYNKLSVYSVINMQFVAAPHLIWRSQHIHNNFIPYSGDNSVKFIHTI